MHCCTAHVSAVHVQTAEKGKAVASSDSFYAVDMSEPVTDWQDYSNYYDEYDDDEEVCCFSLSDLVNNAVCVVYCISIIMQTCNSAGAACCSVSGPPMQ